MSDGKTIAVSIVVFLTGVAASVAGTVAWGSLFAITVPLATGLTAAIIILTTVESEK